MRNLGYVKPSPDLIDPFSGIATYLYVCKLDALVPAVLPPGSHMQSCQP